MVQIHVGPPSRLMDRTASRAIEALPGGVAQLVEHLVCNQAVVGSNPVASTKGDGINRPIDTQATRAERRPEQEPCSAELFL